MTVVEEGKNGRERYERIANLYVLRARFQKLGIGFLDQPLIEQTERWGKIANWVNFSYNPATGSVGIAIRGENGRSIKGVFSEDGGDNVFQFSISGIEGMDGVVSAPFRGVKSIISGDNPDKEAEQFLSLEGGTLKGGTILEAPVSVYIYETAGIRVISETPSSNPPA